MKFSTALLIGRRQTGKTTYIVQSALEKIYDGAGIALFDPYGTATDLLIPRIPENRWNDVVLIEHDPEHPIAFNPLYNSQNHSLTTSTLKHTLKGIWDYTNFPTPTLDDILTNSISAILETDEPTLVMLKWFLTSKKRREGILGKVSDIAIKDYWTQDFKSMSDRQQIDEMRSTLTKIRAFTSNPVTRNILGQTVSKINLKDILKDKILIVNVDVSKFGIEASKLIGSLLMAELHQSALAHTNPFYCYIDGADRFAESIQIEMAEMTSGASYMFSISHLGQVSTRFQNSLLGASDILLSFTLGIRDGVDLEKVAFKGKDNLLHNKLYELSFSELFTSSAEGVNWTYCEPLKYKILENAESQIRRLSRNKYTRQRKDVEEKIKRFIGNS